MLRRWSELGGGKRRSEPRFMKGTDCVTWRGRVLNTIPLGHLWLNHRELHFNFIDRVQWSCFYCPFVVVSSWTQLNCRSSVTSNGIPFMPKGISRNGKGTSPDLWPFDTPSDVVALDRDLHSWLQPLPTQSRLLIVVKGVEEHLHSS